MTQFLSETFSSGSFLDGKTADVGGTWSNPTNNWGIADPFISAGRVLFDTWSPYSYVNSATSVDSVQDITVEWTPAADNWFISAIARYQVSGGAQLLCRMSSDEFSIAKLSSSTDWPGTTLATATASIAAGNRSSHTLRFKVSATGAMLVWLDGASVTLTGTTTDNTLTASGSKVGMWGRGASSTQITADDGTTGAPVITGPSGAAVTAPSTANFSASVSGTYTGLRWQRQAAGAGAWADVVGGTGGTTTSYTTGATSVSGGSFNSTDKIRLAVDWSGGTVTSNEVTLTVTAGGTAPGFTVQPANQSSTVGSTATFGFTVSGSGSLTVQVKKNGTNVGSPFAVTAGVSANYTTPALLIGDNGATYAFEATGDTNPAATSNAVTLTVLQPLATTFSFTLSGGNSLTGLKYAVFDQVTPDLWTAPAKKAANGSSNGSGVVTIDVTGLTTRRIGEKGSAILTNSDGTDTGGAQAGTRKLAYYVGAFS